MEPIIHFDQFTFQYESQQQPTIHNISLSIYPGEKVCIVGPSGSGKSTLVHCMNGLIPERYAGKSSGTLTINGQLAASFSLFERSKVIGTVMQDTDSQFIGLTVAEDIAFALENECVEQSEMKKRIYEAAEQVNMTKHLNKQIFELSGGQKQRTAMAGVLVNQADILLFDEPLANLDPATGEKAMQIISTIHAATNKTIVLVEHRLEDVLTESIDRIIVMNEGRIVANMTPNELLQTNHLIENDIREPLYIRLLKYAKVDVAQIEQLDNIKQLNVKPFREAITKWYEEQPITPPALQHKEAIRLENVSFTYSGAKNPTLNNVSTTFYAGEMISIIGANGAGKSTFAKLLCGFEKLKKGKLYIDGVHIKKDTLTERAQKIGYVLQNPNQMFSQAKVFDEVAFGLRQRGVEQVHITEKVLHILKVCGLYPFRNWPIAALSYGQKRRLSIAAVLVLEPKIIVLDEPTAGQDYKHASELMDFIQTLAEQQITIIVITHDMHLMTQYTNRTIVIDQGEIVADARPSEILANKKLVQQANLKYTSLHEVAQQLGLSAAAFSECFIQYERGGRHG